MFMCVLPIKMLFFYTPVFPMLKFKLSGSIKMPLPIEKTTSDIACCSTL